MTEMFAQAATQEHQPPSLSFQSGIMSNKFSSGTTFLLFLYETG
jgi:hypothetical protein